MLRMENHKNSETDIQKMFANKLQSFMIIENR